MGHTAVMQCKATGNPPPEIYWLKDTKRVDMGNKRYTLIAGKYKKLYIFFYLFTFGYTIWNEKTELDVTYSSISFYFYIYQTEKSIQVKSIYKIEMVLVRNYWWDSLTLILIKNIWNKKKEIIRDRNQWFTNRRALKFLTKQIFWKMQFKNSIFILFLKWQDCKQIENLKDLALLLHLFN